MSKSKKYKNFIKKAMEIFSNKNVFFSMKNIVYIFYGKKVKPKRVW
jgi:hypothetical protein